MSPSLRVMKFGGTSVGDADCVRRAAAIVQSAAAQGAVVVVVSAMSGVTNRLVQAAHDAEAGEQELFSKLVGELRMQHTTALEALVSDPQRRSKIAEVCREILEESDRLLRGTSLIHELTPRALDAISGIGERLSALLVAGAICQPRLPTPPVSPPPSLSTPPPPPPHAPRLT